MWAVITRRFTEQYDVLHDTEDKSMTPSVQKARLKSRRVFFTQLACSLLAVIMTTILFLAAFEGSLNSSNSPLGLTHCGDSPALARNLGCTFDIMSFSWLPPRCLDEELIKEFDSMEEWLWYKDPFSGVQIPKAEVARGEHQRVWVSYKFHRVHCTFMWKKLHRALGRGGYVDSYIGNYNHTIHCEHMLLMAGAGLEEVNTVIVSKFPRCESKNVESLVINDA